MLQGINRIGKSWVGRAVVVVLFAFLILSFAIWGIGDIFRGNVRTQVATVGGADIPAETFRTAYQSEFQNIVRRLRQSVTPEQARAFGLEGRVLARLVSEAAFDREARDLGLGVSDDLVRQTVQSDPAFRNVSGAFDRGLFNDTLRQNGFSEGQFVREQRTVLARQQLSEAVGGGVPAPLALREVVHRYGAERRSAEHLTLGPALLGDLPAATDAQIQSFYEDRKASYRAPETRAANFLTLDPAALAKPDAISDTDARAFYERVKGTRFGTPERRALQQIVFANEAEAAQAAQRVKDGTPLEAIAAERGIGEAALGLGTFTKSEMFDPATAEVAFALPEGATSEPVAGRFGPVLVRATRIEPGALRSYEDVAAEVKRDLALERARGELQAVHDAIEDQRAGAKPLTDIAKDRGLPLGKAAGFDRAGRNRLGDAVPGIPEGETLLAAAFKSDVGADSEAVRTRDGGYVWFEVTGVEPARDLPLAEVRERVAEDWRKNEVARGLAEKARALAERANKGDAMGALAAELGLQLQTTSDLARGAAPTGLPAAVVTRIFATPIGQAGSAAGADDGRVLFKVTGASVPPFVTTTQEAANTEKRLRTLLSEDLLTEYGAELERKLGVRLYTENVRRAIGGEQ